MFFSLNGGNDELNLMHVVYAQKILGTNDYILHMMDNKEFVISANQFADIRAAVNEISSRTGDMPAQFTFQGIVEAVP